ncbi:MAG TPA: hypothetical protein V6D10_07335 [Trichocoleus sp.]
MCKIQYCELSPRTKRSPAGLGRIKLSHSDRSRGKLLFRGGSSHFWAL